MKAREQVLKINVAKQQHATPKFLGQTLPETIVTCRRLSPVIVRYRRTSLGADVDVQGKTADVIKLPSSA